MNTHEATGKYTTVTQMPAKTIHAPNLARSAIAPEISATVMIANVAWKPTNARSGYVAASFVAWDCSNAWPRPIWFQSMLKNPTMPLTAVWGPVFAKEIA